MRKESYDKLQIRDFNVEFHEDWHKDKYGWDAKLIFNCKGNYSKEVMNLLKLTTTNFQCEINVKLSITNSELNIIKISDSDLSYYLQPFYVDLNERRDAVKTIIYAFCRWTVEVFDKIKKFILKNKDGFLEKKLENAVAIPYQCSEDVFLSKNIEDMI